MFNITQQQLFILLLYSATVGVALGVVYDVFRIFRVAFAPQSQDGVNSARKRKSKYSLVFHDAIIFLQDIIFWIIVAVVTILFTFMANRGQVRLFALAGQLAGFTIYYLTLGRLVYSIAERIIKVIKQVLYWIRCKVIMPIVRLALRVYKKVTCKLTHRYLVLYTKLEMTKAKTSALKGFR